MDKDDDKIVRKPILTTSCRRNAHNHPEYLDTDALLERFTPLLKSIHKQFCSYTGVFDTPDDISDLWSQIVYEFLRLKQNYDPKRGVDFPGYIKFHLQQRVYHYVTKKQKLVNTELGLRSYSDDFEEKTVELENISDLIDTDTEIAIERAEAMASIPWGELSESQAQFVREVLIEHKSVETIARERRVTLKAVRTELDEVCDLLAKIHEQGGKLMKDEHEEQEEEMVVCDGMNDPENRRHEE